MERRDTHGSTLSSDSPLRWTACAVIIIIGLVSAVSILLTSWRPTMENTDFAQDYASMRARVSGANPYADTPTLIRRYIGEHIALWPHPYTNPHPPFQIITAGPLEGVPFRAANAIWMGCLAIALVASLWLTLRHIGLSHLVGGSISIGCLAIPTVRFAIKNGEPNAIVLLLIVLAWIGLSRGKEGWSGIALGVAAAMRLFPILLVIPLLRTGRRRAALSQVAVAVLLTIVGFAAFGHLHGFVTSLRQSDSYWRAAGHNISLVSIPFRWLTRNPWFPRSVDAPALATALAGALFLALIIAMVTTPARSSGDVLWAVVPWMLLASPLAWADYLILAFPCVILMLHRNRTEPYRLALIGLFSILIALGRPYFIYNVDPVSVPTQLFGLALPTYGLLGLGLIEWLRTSGGHAVDPREHARLSATQTAV